MNLKDLNFKNFSLKEWIICLFPLFIILRSFTLNLFLIICSIILIINIKSILLKILKQKWVIIFFCLIAFLIFNSFFAQDFENSLKNSVSQLRFLFFSLFIYLFIGTSAKLEKILFFQSIIIFLVSLDVFYQYFDQNNLDILGFSGNPEIQRLSGPFGDELIVGAFVTYLSIPIYSFVINKFRTFDNLTKSYSVLFIFISFFSVLLSGERMNTIVISGSLIILFLLNFSLKRSFFLVGLLFISLLLSYTNIEKFKIRTDSFFQEISYLEKNNHVRLISSAYNVWKDNKLSGVGNKNFRIVCDESKLDSLTKLNQLCSSHPHNLYLELLSETGLIGAILFFMFIYFLFFENLNKFNLKKILNEPILVGAIIVIFSYIWPIRSSGSIFTTFNATFFWINIGYFLVITKKLKKN